MTVSESPPSSPVSAASSSLLPHMRRCPDSDSDSSRSLSHMAPNARTASVAQVVTGSRSGTNWHADTGAVQLTTFRPLVSSAAPAAATTTPTTTTATGPVKAAGESSDTSDYENLSSYTSGRLLSNRQDVLAQDYSSLRFHRPHFVASLDSATTGSLQHHHHHHQQQPLQHHTLSLHRPVKRPHWLNHNGRPSDVLARVLNNATDWHDEDIAVGAATPVAAAVVVPPPSVIKDNRANRYTSSQDFGDNSVSEGALQLAPMNSRLCEHDDANAAHLGIAGLPSMLPLMSLSTPLIMQPAQQGCGGSGGFTLANQGNHNHGHTHAIQLQTSLEMGPVVCPALCEIRTQLQELTRSVESCQNEVSEMKRDMSTIRHEVESVHHVKEDLEELRDCVDKLEEQHRRRKLRLLEQGLTCFLSFAIFAAVLGMFQFGYNTGVINAPQAVLEEFIKRAYESRYNEDIPQKTQTIIFSIAVSIFAVGGMIGGFGGGFVADRFGRKRGLILNNLTGIIGGAFMAFSKVSVSYEMLIIGRLLIGFNCGLNTSLVPMYISEIAPLTLRGGLGTVNQLAVTVGILLSQILGIDNILGTEDGWPILLGLAVCPAVLQLILFSFCPESPRYLLITVNREDEARRALKKLRACSQVEEDMEEMRVEAQQSEVNISMLELIQSRSLLMPLIIGIVMQLSQQLSGINAVLYYSTDLFIDAGLEKDKAKFATIGIGAIMVSMTIVTIFLIDRAGRRTLHLWGLGGMFIFSIFITISLLVKELIDWVRYVAVVATLFFVVFFAVGPGSIPWMITAELFSQGPRPAAISIAVLVNWMSNFLVGLLFPLLKGLLMNYTFLPFSVLLAFFWVFTYKIVPETKNKTFEEISALFRQNDRDGCGDPNNLLVSSIASNLTSSIPISSSTPAHTESTALLANSRSTKMAPL